MLPATVQFRDAKLEIIDRDGKPWVRAPQIEAALGITKEGGVRQIYNRHRDEFTDSEAAIVELPSKGGLQKTLIFSSRGCHMIGMFARTERSKAFRKFILDVLEKLSDGSLHSPENSQTVPVSKYLALLEARIVDLEKLVAVKTPLMKKRLNPRKRAEGHLRWAMQIAKIGIKPAYRVSEVAEILHIHFNSVKKLCDFRKPGSDRGKDPRGMDSYRVGPGEHRRIPYEELIDWLMRNNFLVKQS